MIPCKVSMLATIPDTRRLLRRFLGCWHHGFFLLINMGCPPFSNSFLSFDNITCNGRKMFHTRFFDAWYTPLKKPETDKDSWHPALLTTNRYDRWKKRKWELVNQDDDFTVLQIAHHFSLKLGWDMRRREHELQMSENTKQISDLLFNMFEGSAPPIAAIFTTSCELVCCWVINLSHALPFEQEKCPQAVFVLLVGHCNEIEAVDYGEFTGIYTLLS